MIVKDMKLRYFSIVSLAVCMSLCISSCSEEDELTPSYADKNLFEIADDDNSEDAPLRRKFYADNGVYLLFNDTLRHEYVGKDAFGNDVYDTETIDFGYNITGTDITEYRFEYCSTLAEKQVFASFVEDYILPHFKGGSLAPYSFFIAKSIQYLDYGKWKELEYLSSVRSTGLVLSDDMLDMTEEEKNAKAIDLCTSILSSKITYNDERLEAFHAISGDLTGYELEEVIDGWYDDEHTREEALEEAHKVGFLSVSFDSYWPWAFPWKKGDYNDYFNLVMTTSEEEVQEMYGDYPLIIEKYMIMRNLIVSLGYKF